MRLTKKQKLDAVGGLSNTDKMPGHSWSISAFDCLVGSKLAYNPKSVCFRCYARKGRYTFANVQKAQNRRHDIYRNSPTWAADMVQAIQSTGDQWFRVFDSGDLQSVEMLEQWAWIAEQLPSVKFWLPTKETGIVREFLENGGTIPVNMVVRVSNALTNDLRIHPLARFPGVTVSAVSTDKETPNKPFGCPAPKQGNKCQDCRACWDREHTMTIYKKH